MKTAQSRPSVERFDFEPYLRAFRSGQWVYQRRELHDGQEPDAGTYPRIAVPRRTAEGNLMTRSFLPLTDYLHGVARVESASSQPQRPIPPMKGGTAFMFELAEPLEPFPPQLKPGEPMTSTTALRYHDYDGRPLAVGTLTREVEIEGFEDVDCPAGHFPACARIRLDMEIRVSWVLHMYWTSYLWLSSNVGEVRRLQHMSGRFLIFWFASTFEYDLLSGGATATEAGPMELAPKWKYGAVLLDRVVPRPRIAGMVVDYGQPTATHRPTAK